MNRAERRRALRAGGFRGRKSQRGVPAVIAARNAESQEVRKEWRAKQQAADEARARLASLRVWTPGDTL